MPIILSLTNERYSIPFSRKKTANTSLQSSLANQYLEINSTVINGSEPNTNKIHWVDPPCVCRCTFIISWSSHVLKTQFLFNTKASLHNTWVIIKLPSLMFKKRTISKVQDEKSNTGLLPPINFNSKQSTTQCHLYL